MSTTHSAQAGPPPARLALDEQLWPIGIAFVLMCGCKVGWILAVADFSSPNFFENGYVWLISFVLLMAGISVLSIKLGVLRGRRLLLATLISITLHSAVFMVAYKNQSVLASYGPKFNAADRTLRDKDILRDYRFSSPAPNRAPEAHERPVETVVTDTPPPDIVRLAPEQAAKLEAPKADNLLPADNKTPNLVAMIPDRKPLEAAPKRGDLDAKLEKKTAPIKVNPLDAPVEAPNKTAPTTQPGPLEAKSIPMGRQTVDPNVPRRNDEVAIATMQPGLLQPGGPRSAPAPRVDDHPSPSVTSGPKLVKTITEPKAIPRGDSVPAAAPAKSAVAPELATLQPATGVGRQSAPGAVVGRPPKAPTEISDNAVAINVGPARPAGRPDADRPMTGSPAPKFNGGPPKADAAAVADIASTVAQNQHAPTTGPLAPAPTSVARGTTAPGAPSRAQGPELTGPAGSGGIGLTVAMAGPQPGKGRPSAGPNPDPKLPAVGPAGRGASGFAGVGQSPTAAPVAGLPLGGPPGGIAGTPGSSASGDAPAAGPARIGVAKASGGPVGPGRGEGLDLGTPGASTGPSVAMNLGSGGGLARRPGEGAGASRGPAVGIGQPGGLARDASHAPATSGAVAFNPTGGNRIAGGGADPGGGTLESGATSGPRKSTLSGPLGGGAGLGGAGQADIGSGAPSLSVGLGGGTGGTAAARRSNEQASIGPGILGQQLPRNIGGGGGAAGGVASIAGGDMASPTTAPGGTGSGGSGGVGGSGLGPGGPIDSRATGAERTSPGSGIPGGALVAGGTGAGDGPGGNGGNGGGGSIGAAHIGRPGAGRDDLPGGIVGGVPGGLGAGIGRAGPAASGGLAADVQADTPQLAAGSPNGTSNRGVGVGGNGPGGDGTVQGPAVAVARQATGGIPGGTGAGVGGSGDGAGGEAGVGGFSIAIPGSGVGQAGRSGNGDGGPDPNGTGLGAQLPKSGSVGLPTGSEAQSDAPQFAGSPSDAGAGMGALSPAGGTGGNGPGGPGGDGPGGDGSGRRIGSSGLPLSAPITGAAEGPVATSLPQFGLPDRRALPESDNLQISTGRFLQKTAGGGGPSVAADAPVRAPAPSFVGRGLKGRSQNGAGNVPGSDGRTEATIELGLAYLAQVQNADGSWSLHRFPGATQEDAGTFRSDTAATGLALLAFLGAGYDHFDDKYQDTVRGGLDWLVKHQRADGDLFVAPADGFSNAYGRLYSHAIATIAVCEAVGMTGDNKLRPTAQKAIDFIVKSQDRREGGWRYRPGDQSDVSVTGWQTTALESGKLAKLDVPPEVFDRVSRFLDTAQVSRDDGSRYIYLPTNRNSQRPEDSRRPTMTAVALLQRIYLGWRRDDPALLRGADYIKANLPKDSDVYSRDTYYWYYATQVMFQVGGKYWEAWNERLNPILVDSQVKRGPLAGSWDPGGRVPDRWGDVGGRVYVTTMNLLSLEVYFRHLPIYETPGNK